MCVKAISLGLKLYEEVVDTMWIGFKVSLTEVTLSNFKVTVKKFVFTVGSHFKLGKSFGSILSFDCLLKD